MVAIGIMYHEGFVGSICDPIGSAEDISRRLCRTFSVVFDTILLVQEDRVVMQLNKGVDYHVEPPLPDKLALPQITRTTKTSGELG